MNCEFRPAEVNFGTALRGPQRVVGQKHLISEKEGADAFSWRGIWLVFFFEVIEYLSAVK